MRNIKYVNSFFNGKRSLVPSTCLLCLPWTKAMIIITGNASQAAKYTWSLSHSIAETFALKRNLTPVCLPQTASLPESQFATILRCHVSH